MRKYNLIISSSDRERLLQFIERARLDGYEPANLDSLERELERATIANTTDVPRDVVTMNSTVWFRDLDSEEIESFTLVFPHEANLDDSRLSVLAPLGTALLGYRLRDVVEWQVPSGRWRLEITKVDQPRVASMPPPAEMMA
jgi:regulator of nucleoside diphosphate kinase